MTKAERIYKDKLAGMGCMACARIHGAHEPGGVELHHYRGGGWGKGGYLTLIPLCFEHHRGNDGIHGMGTKAFDRAYPFTQADLLADVNRLLGGWAPGHRGANIEQAAIKIGA